MKINASAMTSKFMNRMFRKIDGVVWDLTTGNQGLQDPNGIYTIEKVADAAPAVRAVAATATTEAVEAAAAVKAQFRVSVNPFEQFGMAIPAFATIVAFDNIKEKDIIVGDKGILGWVIDKKEVALTLMDLNGMTKNFTPPKVAIGGQDGVLVVQSLTGLAGDGFAGLQGSLLPLMMMGGDDSSDLGDILPLLLFSQTQGAGNNASAAMLPQLLMMKAMAGKSGGGSSIDKMLPLMLMGGLGGGAAGGINPMMLMMMGGLGGDDSPVAVPGLTQTRRFGAPPITQTR